MASEASPMAHRNPFQQRCKAAVGSQRKDGETREEGASEGQSYLMNNIFHFISFPFLKNSHPTSLSSASFFSPYLVRRHLSPPSCASLSEAPFVLVFNILHHRPHQSVTSLRQHWAHDHTPSSRTHHSMVSHLSQSQTKTRTAESCFSKDLMLVSMAQCAHPSQMRSMIQRHSS